jgi:hypothetical protein
MRDEIGPDQVLPMLLQLGTSERMFLLGYLFTKHPESMIDAISALHFKDLKIVDVD